MTRYQEGKEKGGTGDWKMGVMTLRATWKE